MDPQQELFTALLVKLREQGYDVYDGMLPPDDTPYPFVYLGDTQQLDTANKSAVFGDVIQTIHVYHDNPRQRGTVSSIMLDIKHMARTLHHTDNFAWFMPANSVDQQIMPDDTTSRPLLHGVLYLTFRFS